MMKKKLQVSEHFLVPEHRKLGEEEKAEIMKKYNATEKQFPRISIKDPALGGLDARQGDLIEIKRQVLDESEFYLYYRVVV
ncbi:MAG: DNA-directed RNA polymerase subunit RpoH/Rpb5 C-terminal domain-containing protein [Candidatus Aenigmatarchaeota archaeon]